MIVKKQLQQSLKCSLLFKETYKTIPQIEKAIAKLKKEMKKTACDLDFIQAANLRDRMFAMEKELQSMK